MESLLKEIRKLNTGGTDPYCCGPLIKDIEVIIKKHFTALPSEISVHEMKIGFTCERTGKRWQFDSMTKFIEAFLDATQPARKIRTRMPIQTAPKDGTRILLWVAHDNLKYAQGEDSKRWEGWCIGKWSQHNGGGWTHDGMFGKITGWCSLPEIEGSQS